MAARSPSDGRPYGREAYTAAALTGILAALDVERYLRVLPSERFAGRAGIVEEARAIAAEVIAQEELEAEAAEGQAMILPEPEADQA
jgi:hypothetical protein